MPDRVREYMTAFGARAPRWRCGDPTCPAHTWQRVAVFGEYDHVDVALEALERHWQARHGYDERDGRRAA